VKNQRRIIEHREIDEEIKNLLRKGIEKAGSQHRLAQNMGYSTPTNIIHQFLQAPKYKRFIHEVRLEKLKKFLNT